MHVKLFSQELCGLLVLLNQTAPAPRVAAAGQSHPIPQSIQLPLPDSLAQGIAAAGQSPANSVKTTLLGDWDAKSLTTNRSDSCTLLQSQLRDASQVAYRVCATRCSTNESSLQVYYSPSEHSPCAEISIWSVMNFWICIRRNFFYMKKNLIQKYEHTFPERVLIGNHLAPR